MIVAISSVMLIIGYFRFSQSTEDYYWRIGETTAGIVALVINPDTMDSYLETLTPDGRYEDTMKRLTAAKDECEAQMLYVFTVKEDGIYYVYDTDPLGGLGTFDPYWYTDEDTGELRRLYPEDTENQLRAGGRVDTIMGITQYGWTITVNEPLYGSDGTCKGYVGIDFDVNQVVEERTAYLWQLATVILITTAIFAAIYLYIIQRIIVRPINIIARAADSFLLNSLENEDTIGDSDILAMEINTRDEMESLSIALKSMVQKIDEHMTNLKIATLKSETDTLTSLFNRGAFEQRVSAILNLRPESNEIDAFMMIDVDYFKDVNDKYGHAVGDTVLAECAKALQTVTREADVVGRLGGDEFAVFCKSIGSAAMAEDKARQIRSELLKIIPPGSDGGITASIGIAFAPQDGQEYKDLFIKADEALYKAKEAGRDGFAI
jgi:diguanylate cyclase (GGDEF)-like protein